MSLVVSRLIRACRAGSIVLLAGGCALGALAQSALSADGGLRLSAFGTAGVAHVDAPPGWGFRRDVTSKGAQAGTSTQVDSRTGLLLNYNVDARVEFAGQLVATPRAPYTPDNELVRVAYAAVRPTPDTVVQIGRLAPDALLMSEYRHVGFGYVMVRPPVEFYNLVPSVLDGVEVAGSTRLWGGQVRAALIASQGRAGDYADGPPMSLKNMRSVSLAYESAGWLVRGFISRSRMDLSSMGPLLDGLQQVEALPVPQVAADAAALRQGLTGQGHAIDYRTVSLRKEWSRWHLQAEAMRAGGMPFAAVVRGGYVNLARVLGDVSVYGQYGLTRMSRPPPALPDWEAALVPVVGTSLASQAQALAVAGAAVAGAFWTDQQTWSVGARWDVHANVALKTQWDRVFVRPGSGGVWQPRSGGSMTSDIISFVADFVW